MQKNNEAWNSLFEAEGRRESITMNSLKYWRDGEGKKWKLSLIVGNDSYTLSMSKIVTKYYVGKLK